MANHGGSETEGQDGITMTQKYFSIKNCEFAFKCPQVWERLDATDRVDERHCASCEKLVYLCVDDLTLSRHVKTGHCVAVEDSTKVGGLVIGQVSSDYPAFTEALSLDGGAVR